MLDPSSPPSWLSPAALRVADLSCAYVGLPERRLGAGPRDQALCDMVFSAAFLDQLVAVGTNAVVLPFDSGWGPDVRAAGMTCLRPVYRACRDRGWRILSRVRAGALVPEGLRAWYPDVEEWAARWPGPVNRLVSPWPHLPGLWRPCYESPGWLGYMRDLLTAGLEEVELDGFVLAGLEPHRCGCADCTGSLRAFIAERHPDPAASLGVLDLEQLTPAGAHRPTSRSPLAREWARFADHVLAGALAELRLHLRALSAHVALGAQLPVFSSACCAALDILALPFGPGRPAGDERTEPWALPAAATTRTQVVVLGGSMWEPDAPSAPSPEGVQQRTAAALALGGHAVSAPWVACQEAFQLECPSPPQSYLNARPDARQALATMCDFARRHEHYYHGARPSAGVALLLPDPAWTGALLREEPGTPLWWLEAFARALIPFDVAPQAYLGRGRRYGLLVVPVGLALSEADCTRLCAAVAAGTELLLAGAAGWLDESGRPRAASGLGPAETHARVHRLTTPSLESAAGLLRKLAAETATASLCSPTGIEPLECRLLVQLYGLPAGQTVMHLVNLDPTRPARGLLVRFTTDAAATAQVTWHEPGAPDALLDSARDGDHVVAALPPVRTYALVVSS